MRKKIRTKRLLDATLISLLCVSIIANIIQLIVNINISSLKQENSIRLEKHRDLQARQIQFIKNGCTNFSSDTELYNRYKALQSIASNYPSYITIINREEFASDILFPFIEAYCYRPYILLLGVDDIFNQNLGYRMKWNGELFHFDDVDFDEVRW